MLNLAKLIWQRIGTIDAPVLPAELARTAPLPAHAQEEFADVPGELEMRKRQDERVTTLYERVVRANNDHITRDFGKGPETITSVTATAPLSTEEMAELAGPRMEVRFKHAPGQ